MNVDTTEATLRYHSIADCDLCRHIPQKVAEEISALGGVDGYQEHNKRLAWGKRPIIVGRPL